MAAGGKLPPSRERLSLSLSGSRHRLLPSQCSLPPAMGATRNADGSVTFCIAAPQKQDVMVIGSWNGYKASGTQVMNYIDEVIDGIPFRFFTVTLPENQIPRNTQVMYYLSLSLSGSRHRLLPSQCSLQHRERYTLR